MGRPKREDRATVQTETLTLRLTPGEREVLDRLVEQRRGELAAEGASISAASLVRALILREAQARGVVAAGAGARRGRRGG